MNRRRFAVFGAIPLIAPFTPHRRSVGAAAVRLQFGPGTAAAAQALNDAGQVVGWLSVDGVSSAILWEDGLPSVLEPLPGHHACAAYGVNDAGLIVGWSEDDEYVQHAVLWDRGQAVALPCPDPDASCTAVAINAAGDIAGVMTPAGDRAILWRAGAPILLDPLPGDTSCASKAIDDAGLVIGWSRGSGPVSPAIWDQGQVIPLLTSIKHQDGAANGINRAGQIVGFLATPEPELDPLPFVLAAVRWERQDGAGWEMSTLAPAPDQREPVDSEAMDINEAGQIVGVVWNSSASAYRAVLWEGYARTELSAPAPDEKTMATAINEAGQVVGLSGDAAVLWSDGDVVELPIPDRA
jgi:probable HAF family extracellular repeat protein